MQQDTGRAIGREGIVEDRAVVGMAPDEFRSIHDTFLAREARQSPILPPNLAVLHVPVSGPAPTADSFHKR